MVRGINVAPHALILRHSVFQGSFRDTQVHFTNFQNLILKVKNQPGFDTRSSASRERFAADTGKIKAFIKQWAAPESAKNGGGKCFCREKFTICTHDP